MNVARFKYTNVSFTRPVFKIKATTGLVVNVIETF